MIDLTPLDIRTKRGDFRKGVRGYDRGEVDHFLELIAERLEEVVKENRALRERVAQLEKQVQGQEEREQAVNEALVTAQRLREDIRGQAREEAESIRREAEVAAWGVREDVERFLKERRRELQDLMRMRSRFLKGFRTFLERELDAVDAEEANPPLADFDLPRMKGDGPKPLDSLLDEPRSGGDPEAASSGPGADRREAAAFETAPGGEAQPAGQQEPGESAPEEADAESRGLESWEFDEREGNRG